MSQYRVMSATSTLVQLGESIKATGAAMTDAEAVLTWGALTDVVKALRKAGHPKPKRERLASVVFGQADLLAEAVEPVPPALLPASTGV